MTPSQLQVWNELDKKRTQGEWRSNGGTKGAFRVYDDHGRQVCGVCNCHEGNSRFIAAGPAILAALNASVKRETQLREALEYLATQSYQEYDLWVIDHVNEALSPEVKG